MLQSNDLIIRLNILLSRPMRFRIQNCRRPQTLQSRALSGESSEGGLRADGHEHGRFHVAVGRVQHSGPRARHGAPGDDFEGNLGQAPIVPGNANLPIGGLLAPANGEGSAWPRAAWANACAGFPGQRPERTTTVTRGCADSEGGGAAARLRVSDFGIRFVWYGGGAGRQRKPPRRRCVAESE